MQGDKMRFKLTNTLTRKKEDFTPIDEQNVRLYVCGITPYEHSHIGHARAYVSFDILYRLLHHVYGENHVTYVRNYTDIDDKIINKAKELNSTPEAISEEFITSYEKDMKALNVMQPTHQPRVSTSIKSIVLFIDGLIKKEHAYVTKSGDVMYAANTFPNFGKLANRDLEGQQAGARVDVDTEKKGAHDFVLWKSNEKSDAKLDQAFMPKEFGAQHFNAPGRPGWHIECSAMGKDLLGDTFDIHGGGEDLKFPHHSCEIAQSEALLGHKHVNYWLHNAFITVGGKKMSKSLGNFTLIKDLLKNYSGEAIRLWLLQTHYRKPVDFSEEALKAAEKRIRKLKNALEQAPTGGTVDETRVAEVVSYLADDLNTSKALSVLDILRKPTVTGDKNAAATLKATGQLLGFFQ